MKCDDITCLAYVTNQFREHPIQRKRTVSCKMPPYPHKRTGLAADDALTGNTRSQYANSLTHALGRAHGIKIAAACETSK